MSATRLRHVIATPQEAEAFRILQFDAVEPDREQIYRLVGLKPDRPNHERWIGEVETLVADLRRLLRPRGMYRIDPVRRMERTLLELGSGAVFEGAVSTFLAHSSHVATFIVTIARPEAGPASSKPHTLDGPVLAPQIIFPPPPALSILAGL